jgi:hypothetical protein
VQQCGHVLCNSVSTWVPSVWRSNIRHYVDLMHNSVLSGTSTHCSNAFHQCGQMIINSMSGFRRHTQSMAYGKPKLPDSGGAIWPHCPTCIGHTVEMLSPYCRNFSPPWRVATRHAVAILPATMSTALTACHPHQHKCHFALCLLPVCSNL